MRDRASVGSINLGLFRKDMAQGKGRGAVAVFAIVREQKQPARLRGLLIDIGKLVVAVAGQQPDVYKRVALDLSLPARAADRETRLLEAACRQRKPADYGRQNRYRPAGVVKRVELLLVEALRDQRQIERCV